jgi:threonine synthase
MGKISGYSCVSCDKRIKDDGEIHYQCPECKSNLQVEFDYDSLKSTVTRESFEKGPLNIWRYEALLPVDSKSPRPTVSIGWTPLYEANRLGEELGHRNLLIKDESRNPSASFKDRASAVGLVKGIESGAKVMTGASTGNAGSSMACLSASMGIKPVIFVPHTAPKAKIAQLLLFGARVLSVTGTYDDAFELCLKATAKFGWYNRNTGYNPYTREGKKTCSFEIVEQLGWKVPDVVVVPVGDGNIISGIWKGFTDLYKLGLIDRKPRLLAVQSALSNSIAQAVNSGAKIPTEVNATTIADSISVSLPRDGQAAVTAINESEGFAIEVTDTEIVSMIPVVARLSGVFGEPAGVTGFAGVKKAAALGILKPEWTVVVIMTGSGLKDIDTALKAAGEPETISADPVELDNLI